MTLNIDDSLYMVDSLHVVGRKGSFDMTFFYFFLFLKKCMPTNR
jgi:hypothetical protein